MVFEQPLSGLIKALRANKRDEAKVIRQALEEIRQEVKNSDMNVKASAVLKLAYLEMLGYSTSWAAFHVLECMSSSKFHIKQIGYLAASQSFEKDTDVLMLCTNLLKKDFTSSPSTTFPLPSLLLPLSSSPPLLISSSQLALDLHPDLLTMLTHSRPQARRMALLVLGRVWGRWGSTEDGLGLRGGKGGLRGDGEEEGQVERLRERLADDEPTVVSAAVNVVLELSKKDPAPYLALAPEMFELLTKSTNNWMLIKIIKVFAILTPIEPRLVRKLLPPLTNLISTTPAMSLLYECIHAVIVGGMLTNDVNAPTGYGGDALARVCVDKLSRFLEDVDQNLRYIALLGLSKILPTHPHLLANYHDEILSCIDDPDLSIRMRALDLVEGMVDRSTLERIVDQLISHLSPQSTGSSKGANSRTGGGASASLRALSGRSGKRTPNQNSGLTHLPPSYRHSLINLIIKICSKDLYSNISSFEWYIDILVYLSYILPSLSPTSNSSVGVKVAEQFIDVVARVKAIRGFAVRRMERLLGDVTFLENAVESDGGESEASKVLGAAAWICGEYSRELRDPRPVIASFFHPRTKYLPPAIASSYLHNGVKVFARWTDDLSESWREESLSEIDGAIDGMVERMTWFRGSGEVELQERVTEYLNLVVLVQSGLIGPRSTVQSHGADPFTQSSSSSSLDFTSDSPFGDETSNGFAMSASDQHSLTTQGPPISLSILPRMFFSHELNAVNPKAQSMIAVPDGLDLDSWIGTPFGTSLHDEGEKEDGEDIDVDEYGRPRFPEPEVVDRGGVVLEEGGGRRKKVGGGAKKGKGKKVEQELDPEAERRAAEEKARRKAERLARQREDPYYISGKANGKSRRDQEDDDVDSIPIVKLDLQSLTIPQGPSTQRANPPTSPPVVIELEGEMPDGAYLKVSDSSTPNGGVVSTPAVEEKVKEAFGVSESKAAEVAAKVVKVKRKDPNKVKKKKKTTTGSESAAGTDGLS